MSGEMLDSFLRSAKTPDSFSISHVGGSRTQDNGPHANYGHHLDSQKREPQNHHNPHGRNDRAGARAVWGLGGVGVGHAYRLPRGRAACKDRPGAPAHGAA